MLKQNLHTHSTYCDGKDTLEEMILAAINKSFTCLGFSGHGIPGCSDPSAMTLEKTEFYIEEFYQLKEKYNDKISLFLGIEQDSSGIRYQNKFDYVIGSCHVLKNKGIDNSKDKFKDILKNEYNNDIYALISDYYQEIEKLLSYEEVSIIGHFDLYSKYNENEEFFKFNDEKYLKMAEDCLLKIIRANKIIEINTGAIARGHRLSFYPHHNLLSFMQKHSAKIVLNSDCHNKNYLDCYFKETLNILNEVGFKNIMYLTKDGFKEIDIKEFLE